MGLESYFLPFEKNSSLDAQGLVLSVQKRLDVGGWQSLGGGNGWGACQHWLLGGNQGADDGDLH